MAAAAAGSGREKPLAQTKSAGGGEESIGITVLPRQMQKCPVTGFGGGVVLFIL